MILLFGLLFVICLVFFSALNWRRAVKAAFVIVVFEGALRKWAFPQSSELIYFLKDFVLLGAYLRYYGSRILRNEIYIQGNVINALVFMSAGWCLFQAFNSSLGSPIVGLLGLKAYLFYIPLMWMLPDLFHTEEELYKFLRSHLLLVIPTGLLGIVQFFSPASSPINIYVSGEVTEIATFGFGPGAAVRITGTFSYINSYSGYLIVCFGLLLPMVLTQQRWQWRWVAAFELFLVVINSLMTGSRTTVLSEILFLLGYLVAQGLSRPSGALRLVQRIFMPAAVVIVGIFVWLRPAFEQFQRRAALNQDLSGRILQNFTQPFDFIGYKELDGYGTGATHAGTPFLRKILDLPASEPIPVYYEAEMGRVALELGPIGFFLWYGLRISISIALWLVFWSLKSSFLRQLALAAFLIQMIQLSNFLVFHNTFPLYYWFLSGFVFLLPQLERVETLRYEEYLAR